MAASTVCPECSTALVSARAAEPWCPACEWNLVRFDPERDHLFGWQRADRATLRLAQRLNKRQFAALVGQPVGKAALSGIRVATYAAALLMYLVVAALLVVGGYLIAHDFPTPAIVPGIVLVLLAILLRPRFNRLDRDVTHLTPIDAPALFGLVDRVCAGLGARKPHVLGISDGDFNAYATTVGLRRRRVLVLGLPLWAALPPDQRVALLGHELGHFVNRDVHRSAFVAPADQALSKIVYVLQPSVDKPPPPGLIMLIADALAKFVQAIIARIAWLAAVGLAALTHRERQRAEYLADEMAVTLAGSKATVSLLDTLSAGESISFDVRRAARLGGEYPAWREAADSTRAAVAPILPALRQLTTRAGTSLFATHPPVGLRAQLVESRPWRDGAVGLTETESERIDTELAKHYRRARKDIGQE